MKMKRIVSILLSGVAASAAVAFPIKAQSDSEINREKIYECQKIGENNYVTMMNVNNQSYRLIEWNKLQDSNQASDYHRLVPNPDYPEGSPEAMIAGPDEQHLISVEERCQSVSLRLDTINYNYSLNTSNSEILLLAGRVPSQNLRTFEGNVLRDSQGLPFQSRPWVICAVSQVGESCTRENMLFTILGEKYARCDFESPYKTSEEKRNLLKSQGYTTEEQCQQVEEENEASQILDNFITLINNPGEFQAIQL